MTLGFGDLWLRMYIQPCYRNQYIVFWHRKFEGAGLVFLNKYLFLPVLPLCLYLYSAWGFSLFLNAAHYKPMRGFWECGWVEGFQHVVDYPTKWPSYLKAEFHSNILVIRRPPSMCMDWKYAIQKLHSRFRQNVPLTREMFSEALVKSRLVTYNITQISSRVLKA